MINLKRSSRVIIIQKVIHRSNTYHIAGDLKDIVWIENSVIFNPYASPAYIYAIKNLPRLPSMYQINGADNKNIFRNQAKNMNSISKTKCHSTPQIASLNGIP